MIQPPVAIGLIVCEKVIVEEKTHNVTLVNCLARLRVQEIPSEPHRLIIHAWLTDGIGDGTLRLELLHPDTLEEIMTWDSELSFSNPLQEARAVFEEELSFPVEGRYQFNLLVDGKFLSQRTFDVSVEKETP
ncbi:MAG TPA: hypothetical protein VMF69_27460 [Gemmataceae bacterium]|nr:hypothetical protein [Gemmataceae bacterium]